MRLANCLTLATALALPSEPLPACPAYVGAKELPTSLAGSRRDVRLFALATDGGVRRWISLPVQVDPLDAEGVLLSPPENGQALDAQPVAPGDRIALRREAFGAQLAAGDPAPCRSARAVELADPETPGRFAYLTACTDAPPALPSPVAHDSGRHTIDATRFAYDYQPNNQLMYKRLVAKGSSGSPIVAGTDADLNLHLDVQKFFTMDFDNSDVESYVGQSHSGPVGMVASIDFFLRVLFFKFNLKMTTTAGFYADAGHIPVVIDVPRDAPKMLNPGSGVLYTWINKAATVDQSHPENTMPNVDAALVAKGYRQLATNGLRYCKGATCPFRLRGGIGADVFALDVNVPRSMVERGFFPQWVSDVAAFKKALHWDDDAEATPGAVAVYFDNSGLPEGQYRVDQWIRMGKAADVASSCPRPVKVGPAVSLPPPSLAH